MASPIALNGRLQYKVLILFRDESCFQSNFLIISYNILLSDNFQVVYMDNYCKGWSARDGLCIPQFVKLITNAIVVAVAIVCFYLFNVTAKKLVRFRLA